MDDLGVPLGNFHMEVSFLVIGGIPLDIVQVLRHPASGVSSLGTGSYATCPGTARVDPTLA